MTAWAVGDLAVCVDVRSSAWGPFPLEKGRIYTVARVWPGGDPHILYGAVEGGLELAEVPCAAPEGYASNRFRKIRPDEQEACEEEFVTLLKRSKQRVEA